MKKKSGAARRLVSLVLALGLIFTLAPASVFAGDEVPVSSTAVTTVDEPAVEGTEPAVEGTEPAVEGTEPAEEGTEPAEEGTEPAVEGTEPAEEGTEPAVEGTEPAEEGTEPAVEGTEPAVEGTEPVEEEVPAQQAALVAASVPAVMKAGAKNPLIANVTINSDIPVYAVGTRDGWDQGTWFNDGDPAPGEFEYPFYTGNDRVYFLFSLPEYEGLDVSYKKIHAWGVWESDWEDKEVNALTPESDVPNGVKTLAAYRNCTHYVMFSGPTGDLTTGIDIVAKVAVTDAYFYLHRYDVASDEVETTDFYYVGQGTVKLGAPDVTANIRDNVDSHIVDEPANYNPIVLNEDVNKLYDGLMTYSHSDDKSAGTYEVESWDVIKGADGASWAYPEFDGADYDIVKSGTPTWHVDGTVSLNRPDAQFYAQVEGDNTAVYSMGSGYVTFRQAKPGDKVDLAQIIPDKASEKDILIVPASFPEIEYKGHNYTYTAQDNGEAFTYTVKGWNEAVGVEDGGTAEWRVNGEIKLNIPPEFTDDMKPEVVGTTAVYDGNAHDLTINYKELYPGKYFEVTYEVWNEETKTWNELPLGQVPAQTEAGRMDVRVTFEYRSTVDPHLPLTVETSIVVMPRPLTLTVSDAAIIAGETPTFTVIPSAEGADTGLLTSLGHTLVDWKVNENYNKDVAGEYSITLDLSSLKIVDKDGNDVTKNYSFNLVPGTLTVKALLPADLQPTVGNTSSTYDGQAHGLYISYPDGTSASDYKVEYQIAVGAWSETAPSLTNVDKVENVKVRFTYGDYATYEAPGEYSVEVTKRALTLRVNDDKIEDGERIPAFSYTITSGSLVSGQSITGVTYGGYKDELGIYDVNILTYKIVAGATDVTGNYEVTLLPGVFTIGTAGGGGGTTPTPNPNPNPTPVPVPVEPETPVTPVAPVTPDEEEEEPAEVEDIEEEETPQASPDTDADKEEDKTENIEDEETAQAGAPGEGNWALLNLILMALTVVAGLVMLALRFARKTGMAHLLGIVPAIVALVAFFVTEDMSLPMAMTDKWTLIMALIAVVQVVLLVLGRNGAQEDDQPREQY